MSACRYCLVTVQNGVEFVSTLTVSEEEAESLLALDTLLHRAAGWRVVEGQGAVIARRHNVVRLVRAVRSDPMSGEGNENRAAVA
jgi:hypothetical protein